ncbi:hypothetical protein C2S52_009984 [Perilla frutescens var. hirtella]|nr:hypothetical protein C2S52_009984 [Perilla frutescens var. hirtella]
MVQIGPTSPRRHHRICLRRCFAVLPSVKSAADAWSILNRAFASTSRSHVMQLKLALSRASMGSKSVAKYVNYIKTMTDELGLIDLAITDDDLTIYIINGLSSAYCDLISSIRTHEKSFRSEELHDRLVEHELYLKQTEIESSQLVATVNIAQSHPSTDRHQTHSSSSRHNNGRGGRRGGGRHNHNHSSGNSQYPVVCQLCGYQGHTALYCRRPPQPSAHFAQSPTYSPQPTP